MSKSFCLRSATYFKGKNFAMHALAALNSLYLVTKAFNANKSMKICKSKIEDDLVAIGLCTEAQISLAVALEATRKDDFQQAIFSALKHQKRFLDFLRLDSLGAHSEDVDDTLELSDSPALHKEGIHKMHPIFK